MTRTIPRHRTVRVVGAILATVVALTACSSGSASRTAKAASTEPTTPVTTVDVTAMEFHFDAPQWTVRAGTPFTVHLHNHGTIEHEWAIVKLGQDLRRHSDFREDKVLTEVEKIPQDSSSTATLTIDAPGRYQVICALEGHFDAGMHATLNVV